MDLVRALSELGAKIDLTLVILSGALLLARILPVVVLSPFLGEESVPTEVRIGSSLLLTMVIYPAVEPRISQIPVHAIPYIGLLLKELFIGVTLSFIVTLVFEAVEAAGTLIDLVSGSSSATMYLPELQLDVSLFANFKTQLAIVLFHTLNGHHVIIEALADSVHTIPLDRFPEMSSGAWPFFDLVLRAFAALFKVALAIAAPAILTTQLVELGLGMINRVAPQISVYFIGLTIKPLATVLIMLLAMHLVMARMVGDFGVMLRMFQEAIRLLV